MKSMKHGNLAGMHSEALEVSSKALVTSASTSPIRSICRILSRQPTRKMFRQAANFILTKSLSQAQHHEIEHRRPSPAPGNKARLEG